MGSHTIAAAYSGGTNFLTSNGDDSAAPQAVRTATTTTIGSAPNPSVFGQSVTFTAQVSAGGAGTPTGSVDFSQGPTDLTPGGVSLVNGVATFATSFFSVGNQTITATYSGDTNFLSSAGNDSAAPQVVNQAASMNAVSSSVNPSAFGQLVTFTASVGAVSPGQGLPTGSVDFQEGSTDLTPGGVTLSAGVATFETQAFSVGKNRITAVYGGDMNFIGSQGGAAPQVVMRDGTTTVIEGNLHPSFFGQTVTMTALVCAAAPGSGNPTGTVTFLDGTTTLGTASLDSSLQASFSTNALSRGNHALTAVYGGDAHFMASTSRGYGETVNHAATTLTITSFDSLVSLRTAHCHNCHDHFGRPEQRHSNGHGNFPRRRLAAVQPSGGEKRPGDLQYSGTGRGNAHHHCHV